MSVALLDVNVGCPLLLAATQVSAASLDGSVGWAHWQRVCDGDGVLSRDDALACDGSSARGARWCPAMVRSEDAKRFVSVGLVSVRCVLGDRIDGR